MGFSLPIIVPPKEPEEAPSPRRGFFFSTLVCTPLFVRYWHLADIVSGSLNIRFQGNADIDAVRVR